MVTETKWFTETEDGRLLCQLCPRACRMKPGDRGFCFVRKNVDGQMVLDTYGKSTGFCIDPIEKKPLNHFLPGTPVLSFGTAGCNLGCKFCQNWDISKSREVARLSDRALPEEIAAAAARTGCRSVAFTYNDPVIWAEYAIDTAAACRAAGLKSVAVTAGYITEQARGDFFAAMDAANLDLKSFDEDFYYKLTGAHLQPVLETIEYVCNHTDCWVELTNLIIPDANDSPGELERMCDWVLEHVGPDVPIHFTAFHPDFRMTDRGRTPPETLIAAHDIAKRRGLNYVYVGNVHDVRRQSTFCPHCQTLLIERDWHRLGVDGLSGNRCGRCGQRIPGVFEDRPGDWGARRQPVRIQPMEPRPDRGPADRQASGRTEPVTAARRTTERAASTPAASKSAVQIQTPPRANSTPPFSRAEAEFDVAENRTGRHRSCDDERAEERIHGSRIATLTRQQQGVVLKAASQLLQSAVAGHDSAAGLTGLAELAELPVDGVFVTVKRGQTLRGCCGKQGSTMPLGQALAESAARTARDPRMPPLTARELPYLDLSVSLLGPLRPIGVEGPGRERAIRVGTHGLRIQAGDRGGVLLPQVATEQGWDARQFLDAVCLKAGLPAGAWQRREAELMLFDGVHFGAALHLHDSITAPPPRHVSQAECALICQWVRSNLRAIREGATPMDSAAGVGDLEVLGLTLSIRHRRAGHQQWMQLGIREQRPLQSSLSQMTEQAARWLGPHSPDEAEIDVAVFHDCVHHGSAAEADVRGVDGRQHAIVNTDGRRWSLCFRPQATVEETLAEAGRMEAFRGGTQVYSMHCSGGGNGVAVSTGPRPASRVSLRPPAVAGRFYPADDGQREAEVDRCLEGREPGSPQPAVAAMVPHAALRFSGRIAADVWRRLRMPRRVLIIGPKHTTEGVDWAVAPHDRWQISDRDHLVGDIEMAWQLAEAIPGMQLDARAHAEEHGIEVQLPLLHRLCPDVQLAAIAMHGGSIAELELAADGLAAWMASQAEPPLLVVSSDMNHFADDAENRRRDRLALDALAGGDGARLLGVCQQENISMCGRVPAVLALMVMQRWGRRVPAREIGYATSADSGADPGRVVGYAGVIWGE